MKPTNKNIVTGGTVRRLAGDFINERLDDIKLPHTFTDTHGFDHEITEHGQHYVTRHFTDGTTWNQNIDGFANDEKTGQYFNHSHPTPYDQYGNKVISVQDDQTNDPVASAVGTIEPKHYVITPNGEVRKIKKDTNVTWQDKNEFTHRINQEDGTHTLLHDRNLVKAKIVNDSYHIPESMNIPDVNETGNSVNYENLQNIENNSTISLNYKKNDDDNVLISNEYSDPVDMTPEDLNDLIEKTHLTDAQESTQSSQLQESFANIQENYFSAAGTTANEVSTTANDLENSLRYMDV